MPEREKPDPAEGGGDHEIDDVDVEVIGTDQVTIRVVVRVDYVFARAIPGAADGTTVAASATAVATPG